MSFIMTELEVKTMDNLRRSGFLTRAKGDDSELVTVVFNNGTSKPMRHARKRCLDEIDRWQKILHRLPTREDWSSSKNPKLFSLETIDKLFGSFDAMLDELAKRKQQPITWKKQPKVKVLEPAKEQPPAPGPPDALKDTPKPSPKPKRKKRAKMTKDQDHSDVQLAEFVVRACGGKKRIARANYEDWREYQTESTPSSYIIAKRLGEGSWNSDMFERVHQLIDRKSEADKLKSIVLESGSEPNSELEPTPESNSEPVALESTSDSTPEPISELVSDSAPDPTPEPELKPTLDLVPVLNLPSYRFVSLLDYDCQIREGFTNNIQASNASVVVEVQDTVTLDNRGDFSKTTEARLLLKHSGRVYNLPEPELGIFYLIDSKLYGAIPMSVRRNDLVPVHRVEYPEATPVGVYVY